MKIIDDSTAEAALCRVRNEADRQSEYPFHVTMAAFALVVMLVSVFGCYANKLTVSIPQLTPHLLLMLVLLMLAGMYRWRREQKCLNLVMMAFWTILIGNLHLFPMYMAARQNVAMNDALLARMDRTLGIEVPEILDTVERFPLVNHTLDVAYNTLLLLMAAAIIMPPLCNRMDKAKEFALGCMIAATMSIPVFACFQAIGPWEYYDYTPNGMQSAYMRTFAALKTDSWFVIDLSNRNGLVTFPSFHAVLAILSAFALWPIRYARWVSAILATLIVVSTVTTGTHYVADVLAGVILSAVACVGANEYLRWESRFGTVHASVHKRTE